MRVLKIKRAAALALTLCCLGGGLAGCGAKAQEEHVETVVYEAGEFVTNVKNSKKMLACAITVDLTDSKLLEELEEEKNHVAKDVIVRRLRQLSEEDLGDEDVETTLGGALVEVLNETFETDAFRRAYFVRFAYQ